MATEVRRKPGRIDRIGLKLGEELGVIYDVETFGEVKKAEKGEFLAVGGRKDVIGYGGERGFSGMGRAKTVLGRGEEVIVGHVGVQLLLGNFLDYLGEGGNNGDGTEVGGIRGITGFVDGVDDGVFPGVGKFTGCETGVEDEEKDVADGIKTKFQDPDANTVRASGRGVFHGKQDGPK